MESIKHTKLRYLLGLMMMTPMLNFILVVTGIWEMPSGLSLKILLYHAVFFYSFDMLETGLKLIKGEK